MSAAVGMQLTRDLNYGFNATDVNVQVNNMTSGITATIDSIENSTNYKLFDIVFDVNTNATVGENTLGIIVEDLESGFIVGEIFQLIVN